ncbi:MAG: MBOAT family protein [Lachnospiraceae bacterium]|nr:MBOAT family protein [Lachnospiraceae bacterium]
MLFNSLQFGIFLPIVFAIYWLLPHKYRWILLFVSSYYFYMSWNAKYVFLIFGTTLISYVAARLLEGQDDKKKKNIILAVTAVVCLGVLFFFKYFNFFFESVTQIFKLFSIQLNTVTLNVLLPVGISFYTFQTLSYVIDVYKGKVSAEHHFGYYASFISFFPQLVAGPIERTSNLLPQMKKEQHFDYDKATYGLKLMAWGFFKKLCIADVFGYTVDGIFTYYYNYKGGVFVLAALMFGIQIYCDFSGYSDIAIGCAKLLGIDLMTNFKSPYFSTTVTEFWRRWHISLSTWFRDYVYIPLGGSRCKKGRHCLNLLITFVVSGLWHGANVTFILWGACHGVLQIIENIFSKIFKRESKGIVWWIRVAWMYVLVCAVWIFFRADSFSAVVWIYQVILDGIVHPLGYLRTAVAELDCQPIDWGIKFLTLFVLGAYDYVSLKTDVIEYISSKRKLIRYATYTFLLALILWQRYDGVATFVYFQF